jgi:hypothetical protein
MAARASHIFSLPIPCRLPNAQPSVGFQTNVLPPESLAEGPRLFRLRYLGTGCDQSSVSQDSLANELIAESIGSGNTGKAKAHIELKAKAHIELLLFLTSAAANGKVACGGMCRRLRLRKPPGGNALDQMREVPRVMTTGRAGTLMQLRRG